MVRTPSARFSTNLFFLILEWIINPILTESGGSFESECRMCSADQRLNLTELNLKSWAKFTVTRSA